MNQRLTLPSRIKISERRCSTFEIESRGDTIHRLVPVVLRCLAMRMEVDKTRRNHEPHRITFDFAPKLPVRNCCYFSALDTHVTDAVQTGFGINYSAVPQNKNVRGAEKGCQSRRSWAKPMEPVF